MLCSLALRYDSCDWQPAVWEEDLRGDQHCPAPLPGQPARLLSDSRPRVLHHGLLPRRGPDDTHPQRRLQRQTGPVSPQGVHEQQLAGLASYSKEWFTLKEHFIHVCYGLKVTYYASYLIHLGGYAHLWRQKRLDFRICHLLKRGRWDGSHANTREQQV